MAYTPNTWAAGDTITAQKLNNMEQGIADAGGALVGFTNHNMGGTYSDIEFGAAEVKEALLAGIPVYIIVRWVADDVTYQVTMRTCSNVEDFNGTSGENPRWVASFDQGALWLEEDGKVTDTEPD